jgi:hypothetical protein
LHRAPLHLGRQNGRVDDAKKLWPEGRGVFPYETGSKGVFFLGFNEIVDVAFWPSPNRGNYMVRLSVQPPPPPPPYVSFISFHSLLSFYNDATFLQDFLIFY